MNSGRARPIADLARGVEGRHGHRMEMHQIRYFLAVADTLNFTRAAEQCHVSQPALTRAIQQLEEELGGLLLRRERRLTHLTDFGRLIEPHLRQLSTDADAAKSTAKRFLSLQEAEIRLGVMCTVGPARFMGFLAQFRSANPGCEITLVEGVPTRLSERLLQGEIDLAVMAQPEPFSDRLEVLPLYRERFCIAFPTGHRLEQQNRIRISDVAGETYLRRINCEYRDYLAERLREQGLATRVGFQSEREDWIQMMVAAGFGVCFLPEFSLTIPGVRTQPVTEPEVIRVVSLVSMAGRRFSPAVLAFTRAIRAHDWSRDANG
jgi:LysR family transcriptional regulator, hydrogen peroxide-inducible genes activator